MRRIFEDTLGRSTGPLTLPPILQPMMAAIFAIRDGIKNARERQPPYFWSPLTDPEHRRELLSCWKGVGKIFILAVLLDAVYQFMVFHRFYPGDALIIAAILALVPYILLCGPVNRI